jgi:transcriptional regulator with XRE-family HTH domain
MTISEVLRNAIDGATRSINWLAKESGVSQPALSSFLAGKRALSLANVEKLADYFDLSLVLEVSCREHFGDRNTEPSWLAHKEEAWSLFKQEHRALGEEGREWTERERKEWEDNEWEVWVEIQRKRLEENGWIRLLHE